MKDKLFAGMSRNGIPPARCEEIFKQLLGFSGYGFPESHAASFALLVYASSWVKRHYPAVFAASLLNAQPMGFYAPHTIVQDARRHGVPVRPVDVFYSDRECTLEEAEEGEGLPLPDPRRAAWAGRARREGLLAVRLGLSHVAGLRAEHADRIAKARQERTFSSPEDLARRTALPRHALARLAAAGALEGFGLRRRGALWRVHAMKAPDDLFAAQAPEEPPVRFDEGTRLNRVAEDYRRTGLSADAHPLALLRDRVRALGVLRSDEVEKLRGGRRVRAGGMVIVRQRPMTAKGIVFITLEDETGFTNLVVMPDIWERDRADVANVLFLGAEGKTERSGRVVNVKVERLFALALGEHPVQPPEAREFR